VARKSAEEVEEMDEPQEEPKPRAKSARAQTKGRAPLPTLRVVAWTVIVVCVLVAAFLAYNRTEQFLIRDARFALAGDDGTGQGRTLDFEGASHASARAMEAVFADDYGRSVYLVPLADRRASLRSVDWVKDASIARLWPNRLSVHVVERVPVAFVTLESASRASGSRFGLIDEDGVILPPAPDRFGLPVLSGIKPSDSLEMRQKRVRAMRKLLRDLGDQGRDVSEVDVTDPDNLKVTEPRDGHMIKLLLGDHNFALRFGNFVSHYSEIVERLPGAVTLDLRLEDRITVVE
jgi:cell division protein FtsQ